MASSEAAVSAVRPAEPVPHAKYERLIERAKAAPASSTIVVHPCDETSLRGPVEAAEAGIIEPRDMASPSTPVAGTPFFDLK